MTVHLPILVLLVLAAVFPGLVQQAKQSGVALLCSFFCWVVELDQPGDEEKHHRPQSLPLAQTHLAHQSPPLGPSS